MRDIETIIDLLTSAHPGIVAEQLQVAHPGADDDGVWFFRYSSSQAEVQLESSTGNSPFIFETSQNGSVAAASTVAQATALVVGGLGLLSAA